jgi:outer membrane receptor protein involved in Fe transport
LKTERALTGELGADYTRGPLVMSATVFRNDLHDAVTNITLAHGPGAFPIVGFIPAGGVGRQRLNLDLLRVQGVELSAKWQAGSDLSFSADFLYDDTAVLRASLAPALAGKSLAQVPRESASLGASWRPVKKLTVTPRVRALGRQYEDDENLLRLGAALVVDLGVSYRISSACEIFLRCENLTNERVETGRSTDGIVNTGTPRFVQGGLRCTW